MKELAKYIQIIWIGLALCWPCFSLCQAPLANINNSTVLLVPKQKQELNITFGVGIVPILSATYAYSDRLFASANLIVNNTYGFGYTLGYYKTKIKSFDPFQSPRYQTNYAFVGSNFQNNESRSNSTISYTEHYLGIGTKIIKNKFYTNFSTRVGLIDAREVIYSNFNPDVSIIYTIDEIDPLLNWKLDMGFGMNLRRGFIGFNLHSCIYGCQKAYELDNPVLKLVLGYRISDLFKRQRMQYQEM